VTCICGKGESLETCCGPYLKGTAQPETAEALMRARYAAYALGEIDYILTTHDPDTAKEVDRESTEAWSKSSTWLGLEILGTEKGAAADSEGAVDFVARYKLQGVTVSHRERATFRKLEGRWVFIDGKEITPPPVKRAGPAVGRNDPCPCGSGKKYKKCCGATANA
jgi:SEC-C motif-containing protein